MSYDGVFQSVQESKERLGLGENEALGTLLLHFPGDPQATISSPAANRRARAEAWRGMEAVAAAGLVLRVGVSNFSRRHLKEVLDSCSMPPAVLH